MNNDEQLTMKDAEIAKLREYAREADRRLFVAGKDEGALIKEFARRLQDLQEAIQRQGAEIIELKGLLEECSDCLEEEFGAIEDLQPELQDKRPWNLIIQARNKLTS